MHGDWKRHARSDNSEMLAAYKSKRACQENAFRLNAYNSCKQSKWRRNNKIGKFSRTAAGQVKQRRIHWQPIKPDEILNEPCRKSILFNLYANDHWWNCFCNGIYQCFPKHCFLSDIIARISNLQRHIRVSGAPDDDRVHRRVYQLRKFEGSILEGHYNNKHWSDWWWRFRCQLPANGLAGV